MALSAFQIRGKESAEWFFEERLYQMIDTFVLVICPLWDLSKWVRMKTSFVPEAFERI